MEWWALRNGALWCLNSEVFRACWTSSACSFTSRFGGITIVTEHVGLLKVELKLTSISTPSRERPGSVWSRSSAFLQYWSKLEGFKPCLSNRLYARRVSGVFACSSMSRVHMNRRSRGQGEILFERGNIEFFLDRLQSLVRLLLVYLPVYSHRPKGWTTSSGVAWGEISTNRLMKIDHRIEFQGPFRDNSPLWHSHVGNRLTLGSDSPTMFCFR